MKSKQEVLIDSESFNNYFIDLVCKLYLSNVNKNVPNNHALEFLNKYVSNCSKSSNKFEWVAIKVADVLKNVKSLSSSRSQDYYGVSNWLIKEIIDLIIEPLTFLYNMILEEGVYPKALKLTKVTPVFKKGVKLCPSSYRPISSTYI